MSSDMKQNLALIGALPYHPIEQVRVHWLLDLIRINKIKDLEIRYDFTELDDFIELLAANGLNPGFELMGNPSNYYSNFENETQVLQWKSLIKSIAYRYINKYGYNYVSAWNFETWNEPDHYDFDGLNITIKGYLNYYDASYEGLKEIFGDDLKFSGPSDHCLPFKTKRTELCWALLDHIISGTDPMKSKLFSVHEKGENGNTKLILENEMKFINLLENNYLNLTDFKILNTESDPSKGWSKPYFWKSDTAYAGLICSLIIKHIHSYWDVFKGKLSLLSNDNSFLSYHPHHFTQRTLLARFRCFL